MTFNYLRHLSARNRWTAAGLLAVVALLAGLAIYCSSSGDDGGGGEDLSPAADYLDNIDRRVESGDWTLEEGLIQTLRLFTGEANRDDILQGREVLAGEGTGVVLSAHDYVRAGPDDETKEELSRLLDDLFFTSEELESISEPLVVGGIRGGPLAMNLPDAAQPAGVAAKPFDCDAPPAEDLGQTPCFQYAERQYGIGTFRVYVPAVYATGPELQLVDYIIESIDDTVPVLSTYLSQTRDANIVFTTQLDPKEPDAIAYVGGLEADLTCPMTVFTPTVLQVQTTEVFKQTIAHELVHCYQQWNFPQASEVSYKCRRWWTEGSADYFSNVVYPTLNDEWGYLGPWLEEKGQSLVDRAYETSLFFQFWENRFEIDGVVELIQTLPKHNDACRESQRQSLAAYPNMEELWHDFGKEFLGPGIKDTGGEMILLQYDPEEHPIPASFNRGVGAFILDWYTIVASQPEQTYRLSQQPTGTGSASAGQPPTAGWAGPLPDTISACPSIRLTIVLTAIKPGYQHILNVEEDPDAEGCPTPTPEPDYDFDFPPLPGPGDSNGEPHLRTFDGLDYDFQAVGEFILTKSTDEDDLELQVRQVAIEGSDTVSVNGAIAFNVEGDTVGVYATRDEPLTINGEPQGLPEGEVELPGGGLLTGLPDRSLQVEWRDGTRLVVWIGSFFINLSLYLDEDRARTLEGLLGNANGDPADDITTRDGETLPADPESFVLPVRFTDLYNVFGRSWRIDQDESLFDYEDGESTETFTDEDFPAEPTDIGAFTETQRREAEGECREAGVLDTELLEDCAFDILVTGEPEFALLAAKLDDTMRLSETPGNSVDPQAEIDGDGNLHVIWSDDSEPPGDVFHRMRNPLGQWSDAEQLSASASGDFTIGSVWLLRSPSGEVCAFWSGGFRSVPYGLYRRCFARSTGWTPAELVAGGNFTTQFYPAFSPNGDVQVVSHTPPQSVQFRDAEINDGGLVDSVRFAITSGGTYHVVWQTIPDVFEVGERPRLVHVSSTDRGVKWSAEQILIDDTSGVEFGRLVADSSGGLTLDWAEDGRETVLRWREDSGWGEPDRLEEMCCEYVSAVGEDGGVHVISLENVPQTSEFQGRLAYAAPASPDDWQPWAVGYLFAGINPRVAALAIDTAGEPHVIFSSEGDLYYVSLQ